MPDSFKYRLKKLALTKKLILIGSIAVIIGVFLPWYKDIDKFKTGDMFLGITGPLYLAGLIVLLAAIASLGIIALKLFEKPIPKLPLKEIYFHIFNSALSLLMLILTVSVYFHHKFGINLIDKSVGMGMILAFIGSGLMMTGAIWATKRADISFEEEGHLEPLIDLEAKERETQTLEPEEEKKEMAEEPEKVQEVVQESLGDFRSDVNDTKDIHPNE